MAKGELKCVMLGRKPFTRLVGTCADILQRNQDLYEEVNAQLDGVSAPPTPPPVRPWPLSLTYELPRRAAPAPILGPVMLASVGMFRLAVSRIPRSDAARFGGRALRRRREWSSRLRMTP